MKNIKKSDLESKFWNFPIAYQTHQADPNLEEFRKDLIINAGRSLDKVSQVKCVLKVSLSHII